MQWEKFKDQFHPSWENKIKPFIESKQCDEIYTYLKESSKKGVRIFPDSSNTFRVFKETPLNEISVILLSYCPYHSDINGIPVADGIGFSCSISNRLQPSLDILYKGLEQDLYDGLNLDYYKNPDLTYLCKQGILLLNSSLTVAKGKPGSHQEIWKPFTRYLLEEVFAYTGIPIVFIGRDAQFYERYVSPLTHGQIFKIEHPSAAARENREWDTKGVFKKVTTLVKQTNGFDLKWLCNEEEIQSILDKDNPPF